jgi:PHD/YefM family antitoxin component YafN of YafNO toxin-antitoxin module
MVRFVLTISVYSVRFGKWESDVIEVKAAEFAKNFGRYKELAQREPVAVTSHGRTSGYFVSEHEFAEYQLLKSRARRAVHVSELAEKSVRAIAKVRMHPKHNRLNALLDD